VLYFVNFQVKLINFDGMSKRSAAILKCWLSQGSAATQLWWDGKPCNSHIREFPWEFVSERILKIGRHLPKLWSKVKCIVFWDILYIANFI